MKTTAFIFLCLLGVAAEAQLSTSSLGPSGLPPAPPKTNSTTAGGILLYAGWDKRVTGPARQQNRDMADLRAILEKYGQPAADLAPRPEAQIFPGIPYLTPLKTVEAALAKQFGGSFGLSSEFPIATEGFPKGVKFRKYDRASLRIGENTHVYMLIDGANRVISLAFIGRGAAAFVPHPFPPFIPVEGQRYRNNLIDKSDGAAEASVADARGQGKYVVVYTVGARNITWYVPEPMINLILYCSQL